MDCIKPFRFSGFLKDMIKLNSRYQGLNFSYIFPFRVGHNESYLIWFTFSNTKEIEAMKEVFKDKVPPFSSTKSITGHSLGATSVQEAIYCLLMMKNKFIAASANVKDLDEKIKGLPIVTEVKKNIDLNCVMSNSFGFGGTNATLVFESI